MESDNKPQGIQPWPDTRFDLRLYNTIVLCLLCIFDKIYVMQEKREFAACQKVFFEKIKKWGIAETVVGLLCQTFQGYSFASITLVALIKT